MSRFQKAELEKRIKNFSMKTFLTLLEDRMDQIDEQLLDLLQSFSDFETFKELMLDYKRDIDRKSGSIKKDGNYYYHYYYYYYYYY